MFGAIKNLAAKVKAIDQDKIMTKILSNPSMEAQIIDLNQKQLYEEGLQADGSQTGQYHHSTIAYKEAYGDARGIPGRTDHITGLDTGATYNSMKVKSLAQGIEIEADNNGFFDRETKGLGLTTDSKKEIIPKLRETLIEEIKKDIKA